MDADLSRRLAKIMQSPMYMQYPPGTSQEVIDACVKANTWDELSEDLRSYFEACEKATEIANKKGHRYPFTDGITEDMYSEAD